MAKPASERQYSEEDLRNAAEAVKNKLFSVRGASQHFKVPRSTLKRAVQSGDSRFKKKGPPSVLTPDEEF